MSTLSYSELVLDLFPRLTGGIRWGLDRTRRLLAAVGEPQRSYRTVHIGGTNGKGSVAALMACTLQMTGHRIGLYCSPHLCTFRERIQCGGVAISEEALVAAAERLWPTIQEADPTFFEATTAIGFLALAEVGAELVVVEVGLGGRLDATNVITPAAVALTNVTLDHVQLLGDTIDLVAGEKAGIIKAGVPVTTAEVEPLPLGIFRERARALGAPFHPIDPATVQVRSVDFAGTRLCLRSAEWGELELSTPLIGRHQASNAALAAATLGLLPEAWRPGVGQLVEGFRQVYWPGRLQVERIGGVTWILDVAHNVAGVQVLVTTLEDLQPSRPLAVLVGVLGDKDWRSMLAPLYGIADAAVLTLPPTAPEQRRWDPEAVLRAVPSPKAEVEEDFAAALGRARQLANGGTVVVTGSFHTVGDALITLGRAPFGADQTLPTASFAA